MSKTQSVMLSLGTEAPPFSLKDVTSNQLVTLNSSSNDSATLVMFICNHCPYVKHVNAQLTQLAKDYIPKGIRFLAISSNNVDHYPEDSPENMKITAQKEQYPFPYLYDETQEVAKAYNAACTPDFFLFNKDLALVYRGQLDDSRPGNLIKPSGNSLRIAFDCLLNGLEPDENQKPSLGCNIKWK